MPLQVLQFRPGVSRESTSYANEGAWYQCDKVRFRSGLPEKIGGWIRYSSNTYLGTCRHFAEWVSLSNYILMGVGTNLKYYILVGGVYFDITPIRLDTILPNSSSPASPFYSMYSQVNQVGGISSSLGVIPIDTLSANNFDKLTPFVVKIDSEEIFVPVVDAVSNTLGTSAQPCIRGYNSTTKTTHADNTPVASSLVIVAATGNNAVAGDFVTFSGATTFGTVYTNTILNKEYQIAAADTDYVSIDTGVYSTSTANGGGSAVQAQFQINTGSSSVVTLGGWGAGPWPGDITGSFDHPWNEGYTISGVEGTLRTWSADNFGQDLVYNPTNGGVYYWFASTGLTSSGQVDERGIDIRDYPASDGYAPYFATRVLVTDERHIAAFGIDDPYDITHTQDPMLVGWCSQENPAVWDPSDITNTAGNYRLSYGSKIVSTEKTRQEILVWTDSALYSMRYLGPPYVYGFTPVSAEISIISPNCVATANGITYWMGNGKFYAYSGRIDTLPCSLRQYIFDDFNYDQGGQVCCGTNEKYNEIWWHYPSENSDTNNRYVIYNYLEKLWYYGSWDSAQARTAWFDSHIVGYPFAAITSYVLQHEVGTDDGSSGTLVPLAAYIESADFDIGDGGNQFSFVKRIIPDVDFIGSSNTAPSVTMTLQARNFPGVGVITDAMQDTNAAVTGTEVSTQVYNYTNQAWVRLRGRQVIFKVESASIGTKWQLGTPRLDLQPDGRR